MGVSWSVVERRGASWGVSWGVYRNLRVVGTSWSVVGVCELYCFTFFWILSRILNDFSDFNEFDWISYDFNESQGDFNGFQKISTDFSDFSAWLSDFTGFQKISHNFSDFIEFQWISLMHFMIFNRFQRISNDFNRFH